VATRSCSLFFVALIDEFGSEILYSFFFGRIFSSCESRGANARGDWAYAAHAHLSYFVVTATRAVKPISDIGPRGSKDLNTTFRIEFPFIGFVNCLCLDPSSSETEANGRITLLDRFDP